MQDAALGFAGTAVLVRMHLEQSSGAQGLITPVQECSFTGMVAKEKGCTLRSTQLLTRQVC
jgi:hypothetical protein